MKYFFPLKFAVLLYSFAFLIPLFFIIHLENTTGFMPLKILLASLMLIIFISATIKYPEITLGAFVVYLGVYFALFLLFPGTIIGYLVAFLFIVQISAKFSNVNETEGKGMSFDEYEAVIMKQTKD